MDTMRIRVASAAVTGARHHRVARNGQDAAAAWAGPGCGAVVVCDGCSAGASTEVGARLGAQLVIGAVADALQANEPPSAIWPTVRARVVAELERLVELLPGERAAVVRDHFLFTIVAAAWSRDDVAVWALGDGGYALGDRGAVLGPFADNEPPYLGYDLLGNPQPAHVDGADARCGSVVVATDGACELAAVPSDLVSYTRDHLLDHPDALRRSLALAARNSERILWEERRVERRPARLQDDGAVAVLRWSR